MSLYDKHFSKILKNQPKVGFTFQYVEDFWVENAVGNRRLQQGQWFFEQYSRRRKAEKTGAETNIPH